MKKKTGAVVRNISQAKAELAALIAEVQKGNEVILTKGDEPVAKLVAYGGPTRRRTPGSLKGRIWIAPDFDVLPEDMAETFGVREAHSRKRAIWPSARGTQLR